MPDTATTVALVTYAFFSMIANGGQIVVKSGRTTTFLITVPSSTPELTSISFTPISLTPMQTSTLSNGSRTVIATTTIVPEDDGSSPSNPTLTSTSYSSISNPSDRASSVLTTSSPTVPTADSPSTPRPTPNNLIAPGAAAGIGVGSAAAGAFIAALIVWFIMRKARKSPKIPNDDPGGSWLSSNTA